MYAVAQGAVSLGGGFAAHTPGATAQKSHPTVALLSAGALVERELPVALEPYAVGSVSGSMICPPGLAMKSAIASSASFSSSTTCCPS